MDGPNRAEAAGARRARPAARLAEVVARAVALSIVFTVAIAGAPPAFAQTTIYTWTDGNGVVHFSDSAVPSRGPAKPLHLTPLPAAPRTARASGETAEIPLVILNDDPSRKFVRAVLEGESSARETLMLVDTGAQMTVIDEELARELALEYVQEVRLVGITGAARGWIGRLSRLGLGSEEVLGLPVIVGPNPGKVLLGMDVLEHLGLSVGRRSLRRTS